MNYFEIIEQLGQLKNELFNSRSLHEAVGIIEEFRGDNVDGIGWICKGLVEFIKKTKFGKESSGEFEWNVGGIKNIQINLPHLVRSVQEIMSMLFEKIGLIKTRKDFLEIGNKKGFLFLIIAFEKH
ncbi:MAG TPA: hypothetical protein P5232_01955 [Candidatus Moranbacteria bacterium]|nr:hypothetical protein [Candidatus Moranbacteria bacterium]